MTKIFRVYDSKSDSWTWYVYNENKLVEVYRNQTYNELKRTG